MATSLYRDQSCSVCLCLACERCCEIPQLLDMLPVEADDKMYMKKKARMFDMTSLSVDGVNLPVRVVVF